MEFVRVRLNPPAIVSILLGLLAPAAPAQTQTTYEDHVLPILRNKCLRCHNSDRKKADLNLSTFQGALQGSGNGPVLEGGDPDASLLFKAVSHTEEPFMPPNDKLPEADIGTIRTWIEGGLLETSGSQAILSKKPKVNLALGAPQIGKPEGPPPMPVEVLAVDPYLRTERTSVSTALAVSPWSPLVAVGGQRQVLLYNTDTLQLEGIVPFPEGYPQAATFSANGKLLVIGGGRGAQLGLSVIWDVVTGEKILSVGDDLDAVLAADISPDQQFVAHGGPDRLVRIFSTGSGELVHKIKKHTDWITAVRFSPQGQYLASGDRAGGLHVWEARLGSLVCSLNGHRDGITGIAWANTNLLITASEDGTAKIWNTDEFREVKSWNAHGGGVLDLARIPEGTLVTCGRDGKATLWDPNGKRLRDLSFPGDLPARAVPSHDGKRVVGSDWNGMVYVWNAADGKELGRLPLNPLPMAEQLAALQPKYDSALATLESARANTREVRQTLAQAQAELDQLSQAAEVTRQEAAAAKAALEGFRTKVKARLVQDLQYAPDSDKAAIESKVAALEEKIQTATQAVQEAETAARQSDAARKAARHGALAKRVEALSKQLDQAKTELAAAENAFQTIHGPFRRLQVRAAYSEYFKARESWQAREARQQELQFQVQATQAELDQTRAELAQAESIDLKGIQARQLALLEKARETQADLQNQQATLESNIQQTQAVLADLEKAVRDEGNQIEQHKTELAQAEAQLAQRRAAVEAAETAARQAQAVVDEKTAALHGAETQLADIQKRVQEQHTNLNQFTQQREGTAQGLSRAAQEVSQLETECRRLEPDHTETIAQLTEREQAQSTALAAARKEFETLGQSLAAEAARVEQLKQTYQSLRLTGAEQNVSPATGGSGVSSPN